MLKSKKMLGRMNDLPLVIGFIAIAGICVYYFYNYQEKEGLKNSKVVVQMREKK